MEAHDERLSLIAEQRPELTAAFVADDDYDFAFNLQMQEAMNASLTAQPFNLESFDLDIPEDGVMEAVTAHFLAEEMERFERYRSDGEVAKSWMKDESFRVYCKGLVSEETVGGVKKKLVGIGFAICGLNSEDVVFKARKCLTGGGEMSGEIAEVEALIKGLNAALTLGLQGIDIFCDINSLYQYVTGKLAAREGKITMLFDQVNLLWKKFTFCGPNLVEKKDIKYAYELARDAIAYQLTQPEGSSSGVTREMIYCPYPNCSSPMSKNEVCTFSATGFSNARNAVAISVSTARSLGILT